MPKKLHIKKGDTVIVVAGNSRGHQGRVLAVFPDKQRAIVEGAQMISKHTKPTNDNPQGGVVKKEASIHISNIMLVDPSGGEATRIGRRLNDDDKLVRYSVKSGEEIK